jgi:hypothetical protein
MKNATNRQSTSDDIEALQISRETKPRELGGVNEP